MAMSDSEVKEEVDKLVAKLPPGSKFLGYGADTSKNIVGIAYIDADGNSHNMTNEGE